MNSSIRPGTSKANNPYGLPPGFLALIAPYISDPNAIPDKDALVRVWQAALRHRAIHPEYQEAIAEWTVSVGSASPLVSDNDLFEAIHAAFGYLEVRANGQSDKEMDQSWRELKDLVAKTKTI